MAVEIEAYYFGCRNKEVGHYLWRPGLNGGMLGLSRPMNHWMNRVDGFFAPRTAAFEEEPEGIAAVHLVHGFTVLAFWDRSSDKRGNSSSTFMVKGLHDFDEMVSIAREAFPSVWERFQFEVKLHPDSCIR